MPESDLLDLQKWQAVSHPDLANRKPTELFPQEFAERYERLHNDLWYRITRLRGTIYTLDQLEYFPFDQLYAPNGMEFWRLVVGNFLDMAIILLHGIVNDTVDNAHTIRRFKNEVVRGPWLDQQMRNSFMKSLQECKFDRKTNIIAERVEKIRHHIAHRLVDLQTGLPKGQPVGVNLQEFRGLFYAVHRLFGVLCFGSGYATLAGDQMPATVGGQPTRSCLDEVLDAVLRDSYFVNEPERDPSWHQARSHMPSEDLRIRNELRQRVGLPTV